MDTIEISRSDHGTTDELLGSCPRGMRRDDGGMNHWIQNKKITLISFRAQK